MLRNIFIVLFVVAFTVSVNAAEINKKHKKLLTTFDVSKYGEATVIGIELSVRNEKHNLPKDKSIQIDLGLKKKKKDIGTFYITNRNYGGKKVLNTNMQSEPGAFDSKEFRILYGLETIHATLRYVDGDMNLLRVSLIIRDPNDTKKPIKKIRSARFK
jgi:hypothetical protein